MSHDYQDDPHLLQAIGEVVVAASRLEYHVARLVWLVTGREVRKTLRPNGVRDALAALADSAHAEGLNDVMRELGPQTLWLLGQRHELVHAVAQWDVVDGEPPTPVFWHPKGDEDLVVTVARVRELAHQHRRLAGKYARLINSRE